MTNNAVHLSDDQLQDAYFEAVKIGLVGDHFEHLKAEMIRRGLLGEA